MPGFRFFECHTGRGVYCVVVLCCVVFFWLPPKFPFFVTTFTGISSVFVANDTPPPLNCRRCPRDSRQTTEATIWATQINCSNDIYIGCLRKFITL